MVRITDLVPSCGPRRAEAEEASDVTSRSSVQPNGAPVRHAAGEGRQQVCPPARYREDLSSLENLPNEVKTKIFGYLRDKDQRSVGGTSTVMHEFRVESKKSRKERFEALKNEVDQILQKPFAERTLAALVEIGLLPAEALTALEGEDYQAHQQLLLTDTMIQGLLLNRSAGLSINFDAFKNVPADRLPPVYSDEPRLLDHSRGIASRENDNLLQRADGSETSIISEIVRSHVFTNVFVHENTSLLEACMAKFDKRDSQDGEHISEAHLALLKDWIKDAHEDVLNARREPVAESDEEMESKRGLSLAFQAATTHEDLVDTLIDEGVNFNLAKADGDTPLIAASNMYSRGTRKIASKILERTTDIDVNHADKAGRTALHWAAIWGDIDLAVQLIARHANVNQKTVAGKTPLHLASVGKNIDLVRELIQHNARVDEADVTGRTALHLAAGEGEAPIVALLLNHADIRINHGDQNGQTALFYAVYSQDADHVEQLLEAGANVNHVDHHGMNVLHHVCDRGRWSDGRAADDLSRMVHRFLEVGVNVLQRDGRGNTPGAYLRTRGGWVPEDVRTTVADAARAQRRAQREGCVIS